MDHYQKRIVQDENFITGYGAAEVAVLGHINLNLTYL